MPLKVVSCILLLGVIQAFTVNDRVQEQFRRKRHTDSPNLYTDYREPTCDVGEVCEIPLTPLDATADQQIRHWAKDEETTEYWHDLSLAEVRRAEAVMSNQNTKRAKYSIIFLGDGMGLPTITAGRIYAGQRAGWINAESFKSGLDNVADEGYTAFSKTYCVDRQTTDSATSATAYLTGVKGMYHTMGLNGKARLGDCASATNDTYVKSVLKKAKDAGLATGIVTTTRVHHASPSGAFANSPERFWYSDADMDQESKDLGCHDLARQVVDQSHMVDVHMGGGYWNFIPEDTQSVFEDQGSSGTRQDGRNLLDEWTTKNPTGTIVTTRDELNAADNSEKILGLFSNYDMPYMADRRSNPDRLAQFASTPTLEEMTKKAIDALLAKSDEGFYLFVEGGRIDHGHHDASAERALEEFDEFQRTIEMVRTHEKLSPDETMMVITADHSHMFSMGAYGWRGYNILSAAPSHGSDNLPLTVLGYAQGQGYRGNEANIPECNSQGLDCVQREDFRKGTDLLAFEYAQQAAAPIRSETHGGEDVAIISRGPWSHLFTGIHEQTYVAHVMMKAQCLDVYASDAHCSQTKASQLENLNTERIIKSPPKEITRTARKPSQKGDDHHPRFDHVSATYFDEPTCDVGNTCSIALTPMNDTTRQVRHWAPEEETTEYWHDKTEAEVRQTEKVTQTHNTNKAKYAIIFLGDGMGVGTLTAGRIYAGQKLGMINAESYKCGIDNVAHDGHTGFSKTYCVDRQTTDSGASATAYLTGVKGMYATVGLNAKARLGVCDSATEDTHVESVLKKAKAAGMATGIVTSTRVNHASPSGAFANTAHRSWYSDSDLPAGSEGCKDLATQVVEQSINVDVHLGGGYQYFVPNTETTPFNGKGDRSDGKDLLSEWQSMNPSGSIVTNVDELSLASNSGKLLGLFADWDLPYVAESDASSKVPSLEQMTKKAIDNLLEMSDDGFYLFVEGGRIDHGHHDGSATLALEEFDQFQKTIEMVRTHPSLPLEETLTVITADHSHVFSIGGYGWRGYDVRGPAPIDVWKGGYGTMDDQPFTVLGYANGRGYRGNVDMSEPLVEREDIRNGVDLTATRYYQQTAAPLSSETHGGEDVPIVSSGPWSHLYSGFHEQTYVAHVMMKALCLDVYANDDHCGSGPTEVPPDTPAAAEIITSTYLVLAMSLVYIVWY